MELLDALVGLSVLFTTLAIYFHIKAFSFWSSRGVPGPTPWPIFGTLIYYALYNKLEIDEYWKDKYGKTFGLYEGYAPMLRTTDAECIKHIYIKNFSDFRERNNQWITQDNPRRWLLWSKGDVWSNQRALVSPMFSANKMRSIYKVMSTCIDRFIGDVNSRGSSKSNVGRKVDTGTPKASTETFDKFDMSSATLDVIASSFFGLKLDTYKIREEPDEFIERAYRFADLDVGRFLVWLFLPRQVSRYFKFDVFGENAFKYFDDLSQKIVKQRKSGAVGKRDDVIQALIDAKLPESHEEHQQVFTELDDKEAHYADMKHEQLEEIQRQQTKEAKLFRSFSDIEIRGQMTFFFIAGFETTASTLSFTLLEMSHQPMIQEKVLAELRDVFGSNGEKLEENDAAQNYKDLLNLKYLDAFVSEVLRMHTPVFEHNRRVTNFNGTNLEYKTENGDYRTVHLPEGVSISSNGHIVQRDPDYFERPNEFDMSRFYPENKHKILSGTYMPFGLGPRYCAGMRFALLEVKLALAKLLLKYKVLPSETSQYPPRLRNNIVFTQFQDTSFRLLPHEA